MWELEGWVGKWKTIQPRFARGNQPYPPFLETAPLGNPKTSLRLRKCCFARHKNLRPGTFPSRARSKPAYGPSSPSGRQVLAALREIHRPYCPFPYAKRAVMNGFPFTTVLLFILYSALFSAVFSSGLSSLMYSLRTCLRRVSSSRGESFAV